jgi:hypothetical protein
LLILTDNPKGDIKTRITAKIHIGQNNNPNQARHPPNPNGIKNEIVRPSVITLFELQRGQGSQYLLNDYPPKYSRRNNHSFHFTIESRFWRYLECVK